MAGESPSQSRATPSRTRGAWLRHWRAPRAAWPYVLAAAALLAASQLLWLWHSWPVREILDAELQATGVAK